MDCRVTVRTAQPEDYADLAELTVAAYRALLGDALPEPYRAELADVATRAEVALVLVAGERTGGHVGEHVGEHVVGGVTYLPGPGPLASFTDPREAGIRFLAVAPGAQGRGVGAALVAACVDRAVADGKTRLSLHTTAPMTTAQRLYDRAGFRRDPPHDFTLDSGLVVLAYFVDLGAVGSDTRPGGGIGQTRRA